jgi:hypothetical protein
MNEKDAIRKMLRENPIFGRKLQDMAKQGKLQSTEAAPIDPEMTVCGGVWPSEINGSKRAVCEDCKGFLSLAPSTQEMIATRTAATHIICMECAMKKMRAAQELAQAATQAAPIQ